MLCKIKKSSVNIFISFWIDTKNILFDNIVPGKTRKMNDGREIFILSKVIPVTIINADIVSNLGIFIGIDTPFFWPAVCTNYE